MANVSIFLQEKDFLPFLIFTSFVKSTQKKINGLLKKRVFEVVSISKVPKNIRIFNSRFVDKIKNFAAANAFEKSRIVVQL